MKIYFISGHRDLKLWEYNLHYKERVEKAIDEGAIFVVGDYEGGDAWAQAHLAFSAKPVKVIVFHMGEKPMRNLGEFRTVGGFKTDEERDAAMTIYSHEDIAWVRAGKERSGTAQNLLRRKALTLSSIFHIMGNGQETGDSSNF